MADKNAREVVVQILHDIESEGAYSNVALKKTLDEYIGLIDKDKNLITEITNGTMKNNRKNDNIIKQYAKTKVKRMEPLIRHVLRMSTYQIMFLDKVPDSAACNEAVEIVKTRNMDDLGPFVNGVLRSIVRNKDKISYPDKETKPQEYLAVVYSFPDWMIQLWLKEYSFDYVEELCEALNRTPDVTIRANELLISRDDLAKELEKLGIKTEKGKLAREALRVQGITSIAKLETFQKGYFTVQDESSMLASYVLDPQKGDKVLDVCAAPGGKSTHMAELMVGEGTITSGDIYDHKLDKVKESAKRMGHPMIQTKIQDAMVLDKTYIDVFDRVLIDAPCSGLGLLHKKSDIRWNKDQKDISDLVKVQREILTTSSKYVKPGGVMVYSTCTITTAENKRMVNWILKNLDFDLEPIDSYIPDLLHNKDSAKGFLQILPTDAGTDGFFISRFRKRG